MKKSILMAALGLLSLNTIAQDTLKEEGFIFTTVKENPITSVKNQNRPRKSCEKRRKRSHINVSNTLVTRTSTPPAQTPHICFR